MKFEHLFYVSWPFGFSFQWSITVLQHTLKCFVLPVKNVRLCVCFSRISSSLWESLVVGFDSVVTTMFDMKGITIHPKLYLLGFFLFTFITVGFIVTVVEIMNQGRKSPKFFINKCFILVLQVFPSDCSIFGASVFPLKCYERKQTKHHEGGSISTSDKTLE